MFRLTNSITRISISTLIIILIAIYAKDSFAENYPIKVTLINKDTANYLSPENAFTAKISALIHSDIDWYYETLTYDTAEKDKKLFKEAGIDPKRNFDLIDANDHFFILDKKTYQNGIVLLIESRKADGRILRGPSVLVRENGLWKTTTEFAADKELHDYLEVIEPPEHLTPFNSSLSPKKWPLPWYNWITERIGKNKWAKKHAEKVTILCAISDEDNDDVAITDILPETLRLNDTVPPQPWRSFVGESSSRQNATALIFPSTKDHPFTDHKGFTQWHKKHPFPGNEKKGLMLVRFNKYEAMKTLPEMKAGEKYEIYISGKLKDDRQFKARAEISLVAPKDTSGKGWPWELKRPPYHNELLEKWWNR